MQMGIWPLHWAAMGSQERQVQQLQPVQRLWVVQWLRLVQRP
jgi:hypothetical protein